MESGTNFWCHNLLFGTDIHLMDLQNLKVGKTLQNKFNQGHDTSRYKIVLNTFQCSYVRDNVIHYFLSQHIYWIYRIYYFCLSCTNFGSLIRTHLQAKTLYDVSKKILLWIEIVISTNLFCDYVVALVNAIA